MKARITRMHYNQTLDDLEVNEMQARTALLRNLRPDQYDGIVVPGDISGLSVGSPLSLALHKPLIVVRVQPGRCVVHRNTVIGDPYGKRLVYVDDQISTGQTFVLAEDEVIARGGRIIAVYLYQDNSFGWLDQARVAA